MIDAAVQLQSEILAACLHKDLRLLRVLIDKLVLFVQEIIEKLALQFPVDVCVDKQNPLTSKPFLDVKLKETVIKLKDSSILHAVLIAQLRVFTKICGLIGDSHPDVLSKVNDAYIKVFILKTTPMRMKIEILNYFTETLKKNMNVTESQLGQIITIVNCFGNLLRYKYIWTSASDDKFKWDALHSSIKAFLKEIVKIKRPPEHSFAKSVAEGKIWIVIPKIFFSLLKFCSVPT